MGSIKNKYRTNCSDLRLFKNSLRVRKIRLVGEATVTYLLARGAFPRPPRYSLIFSHLIPAYLRMAFTFFAAAASAAFAVSCPVKAS